MFISLNSINYTALKFKFFQKKKEEDLHLVLYREIE
jgi:hypothetical protein